MSNGHSPLSQVKVAHSVVCVLSIGWYWKYPLDSIKYDIRTASIGQFPLYSVAETTGQRPNWTLRPHSRLLISRDFELFKVAHRLFKLRGLDSIH